MYEDDCTTCVKQATVAASKDFHFLKYKCQGPDRVTQLAATSSRTPKGSAPIPGPRSGHRARLQS